MTFCCAMAPCIQCSQPCFRDFDGMDRLVWEPRHNYAMLSQECSTSVRGHCSLFSFFFARKMKNVNATLDQVLPQQRKTARTRQNLSSQTSFSHRPSCCAREDRCPSPSPRLFSPLLQKKRDFFLGLCCSQLIQGNFVFHQTSGLPLHLPTRPTRAN